MKLLVPFILTFFCLTQLQAQEKHIKTSDGVDLYVNVKGKGKPCLYIHGGPGSGSYWLEKFAGDSLEQHFQMIYLDQRGVGRSMSPQDQNYSMDRMVKDFEEVRNALGIKQWLTMAHSFGGLLQMGYAHQHPSAIKGMIMINCALDMTETFSKSWCPKACEFLNIKDTKPFLDKSKPINARWDSLITLLNEKDLMWKMGYSSRENMGKMNATFGEVTDWNWDFVSNCMELQDYWKDYSGLTRNMKMPVLFFYGKSDWMIGPKHYRSAKFTNMLLWGSNVGHMPFLENKDDMMKAISRYQKLYKL